MKKTLQHLKAALYTGPDLLNGTIVKCHGPRAFGALRLNTHDRFRGTLFLTGKLYFYLELE